MDDVLAQELVVLMMKWQNCMEWECKGPVPPKEQQVSPFSVMKSALIPS
jgi:hypothetical protein